MSNDPVLLLHGQPGAAADWEHVRASIGDDVRTIAFDRPGWDGHSAVRDLAGNADAARTVLDRSGVARATVVGHSLGAAVAAWLAWSSPERVGRLVLVAPAANVDSLSAGRLPAGCSRGRLACRRGRDGGRRPRTRRRPGPALGRGGDRARRPIPPAAGRTLLSPFVVALVRARAAVSGPRPPRARTPARSRSGRQRRSLPGPRTVSCRSRRHDGWPGRYAGPSWSSSSTRVISCICTTPARWRE